VRIILFINSMNNINTNNFKIKLLFAELSESNGQQKIELFRNIIKLSESNQSNELNRQQKIELFRNIIEALIENEDVMRILDSSHFFVKEHLPQAFKQSSRFKFDKIHPSGVPLKESHEKRLKDKRKTSVKFSSYIRPNQELELQLSNFVDQKPKLRYFTMGSRQHPKQFERWSPKEMYDWWLSLRESRIPKSKWQILDAVFFLFINQISCICNSYIRYGIQNNSKNKNVFKEELRLLSEYFKLLDEFYKSGGEYGLLIDTHLAFCYWFQRRFSYDKRFTYVEYQNESSNIINLFNKKNDNKIKYKILHNENKCIDVLKKFDFIISKFNNKNNFSLILFTSYFQKPSNFISLYCIPVITAIGVPYRSHNGSEYSPCLQIEHDILDHSEYLTEYLINLYNNNGYNDIKIFEQKKIFLQLLWMKDYNIDSQQLLWYFVHEMNQSIDHVLTFCKNIKYPYKRVEYTSKFFDIDYLLEEFTKLKSILQRIIISEKGKIVLPRILDSIDVLIETCEETIEIVKNERQKNYNNYTRTRNPRNEF